MFKLLKSVHIITKSDNIPKYKSINYDILKKRYAKIPPVEDNSDKDTTIDTTKDTIKDTNDIPQSNPTPLESASLFSDYAHHSP